MRYRNNSNPFGEVKVLVRNQQILQPNLKSLFKLILKKKAELKVHNQGVGSMKSKQQPTKIAKFNWLSWYFL